MFITQKELDRRIYEAVTNARHQFEEELWTRKRFEDMANEFERMHESLSSQLWRLEAKLNEHVDGEKHENGTADIPKSN